ncbi:TolB family protein [Longispora urticae]
MLTERAPGARPVRDRRPLFAAVACAVVLAGVVIWSVREPARPSGPVTLPATFPGHSFLAGFLDSSPNGPAIAFYQQSAGHEDFMFTQARVVGARADTYRRLDIDGAAGARLSPDGTRVAVGDPDGGSEITLIDLATARERTLRVSARSKTYPRAWSPDGRYVAVSVEPGSWEPGTLVGPVWLLDTGTGKSSVLTQGTAPDRSGVEDPTMVAFSPDGQHVVVQADRRLVVVGLDGRTERELPLPDGRTLAGPEAWSPDGRLLALGTESGGSGETRDLVFLDATGAGASVPAPVTVGTMPPAGWSPPVLGWRDADTFLAVVTDADPRSDGTVSYWGFAGRTRAQIVEVDVAGGPPRVLANFVTDPDGDLTSRDIQLATALVPGMGSRAGGDGDLGWWPLGFVLGAVACLAVPVGLGALLFRGLVRARRRAVSA